MNIDGIEYKAVTVEKMIINGKEQNSSVISAELTKGVQQLTVNVFTKSEVNTDSKDNETR
jgi:hypothetical protein